MNFLSLTESTAPTALNFIPDRIPAPTATLSPSWTASALEQVRHKELSLIHATLTSLTSHLESIASFATTALRRDDAWAGRFDRG